MARAGDELVNPVTGLRTVFRKTTQETSGELLQVDCLEVGSSTNSGSWSTRSSWVAESASSRRG
jgi:hypothetical protein